MEDKIRSWAVIVLVGLILSGCAGYPKDTPYDPNFEQGQTLFDQIPNNEGEALNRCAGHIPPSERKPHQTGRC
jgi:hypothetical protein